MWNRAGDAGSVWLTKLFNKIIDIRKILDEWKISILESIYKNEREIQNCSNYRGIKLLSYTINFWRE